MSDQESEIHTLKRALEEKEHELNQVRAESVQAMRELDRSMRAELDELIREITQKLVDLQSGS
jgi:hypothetical protein